MAGRPVLDEAIAGSGRVGALHHELDELQRAMADPAQADEMDRLLDRFGTVQEEYDHLGGYGLEAQAREVLHGLGLRRRAHRRRRRRAVGRVEDARRHGPGAARPAGRAADGRAHQPPRHRVDHLAGRLPGVLQRRAADDVARPLVHEPRGQPHRRDRRRRDHQLLRQLRLLRARARHPRDQPGGGLRPPAGDAGQGAAVHRAVRRARRQGRAGAEPGEGAGEDREDRAAEAAPGRGVRLSAAAAVGRPGGRRRRRSARPTARAWSTTACR